LFSSGAPNNGKIKASGHAICLIGLLIFPVFILDLIWLKINAMKLAATVKYGGKTMQVSVRDNNVDQALRALKKKLQREGVYREMKLKQHFEKPSEKKARQAKEGLSRQRKLARKKAEKEG